MRFTKKLFRVTVYIWPVVVGKVFSLLLPILIGISANTCDDINRTATINEIAAIEIIITLIVKPFCLINVKLIIINLLTKKASFTKHIPCYVSRGSQLNLCYLS